MSSSSDVARPYRKSNYRLRFATREAQKGWIDLVATARNAGVDAWEFSPPPLRLPTANAATRSRAISAA